jgi:CRISPR-associated protein Cmr1
VVTPILAGAAVLRALDDTDVIRAATIRGHLRFWWRALHAHSYDKPQDLYAHESELWGRAAEDQGGRSAVELRLEVEQRGEIDSSDIRLYDSKKGGKATPGAYALWPARQPPAPRRKPGTRFLLMLAAPSADIKAVQNAVRAWLLFGGYGSRTRRGLGSLRVLDGGSIWLPRAATRPELARLFGGDIFAAPGRPPSDVPWLAGAELHVGPPRSDAETAWTTALEWLKEFRQGTSGPPGGRAREPGANKPQPYRPSISNWPEADKIRHLTGKTQGHKPHHNPTPVWPRAGFGLPIVGQFQTEARDGRRLDEPEKFEIRWREPDPDMPEEGVPHDRLASPLIVKALPLADARFVPMALWLNRAYPEKGEVFLNGVEHSAAPFDRLVAKGDTARFSALSGKNSLQTAFLDWLQATQKTTKVAP